MVESDSEVIGSGEETSSDEEHVVKRGFKAAAAKASCPCCSGCIAMLGAIAVAINHSLGGGVTTTPAPFTGEMPFSGAQECIPGRQGPSCKNDVDCLTSTGCVRCAKSGHCTDVGLGPNTHIPASGGPSLPPTSPRRRRSTSNLNYYSSYMSCPPGLICGVMALETGLGSGNYKSDRPLLHGLWPQNDPSYGNSLCVPPVSQTKATKLPSCMDPSWGFISHEWTKHGQCAGAQNEADYFDQACSLAQPLLQVMSDELKAGGDLESVARALQDAGYPVRRLDSKNQQVYIPVCAGKGPSAYEWKIAADEDFTKVCR
eukprot:TRINITY_DN75053_c0_g1_i1.p1 TRINITY_DN75053_c0_g1~~TRINITY_DN75053_c0_g1_i1.p1  ORF type:complete len:339 (+),score=38.55 TRINITY_DN75053_c0_g1_i1:75-1019(+)